MFLTLFLICICLSFTITPLTPPLCRYLLCISSLLSDITSLSALFSLFVVVLEAVLTKRRIKPLSSYPFPPSSASLPSFLLHSLPPHLSRFLPHFTSFSYPISFSSVISYLSLKTFIVPLIPSLAVADDLDSFVHVSSWSCNNYN